MSPPIVGAGFLSRPAATVGNGTAGLLGPPPSAGRSNFDDTRGKTMSERYRLPDPKCRHARRGIVKAGEWDGAHASTSVCDRPECIADAMEWARASTHLEPVHITDASRRASA